MGSNIAQVTGKKHSGLWLKVWNYNWKLDATKKKNKIKPNKKTPETWNELKHKQGFGNDMS